MTLETRAPTVERWVNVGRACEMLGVNESTLRRWADAGEIRCFRTPGGHRRFALSDLDTLMGSAGSATQELEQTAVRRIRDGLQAGGSDVRWYANTSADERDELRPLGRRLVELVGDHIADSRPRDEVEAEAAEIGARYGEILVQRKTPLSEAIEAFLFFRRSLDQTAKQLADRHRMTPAAAVDAREQIAKLADRVLQGLTTAFEAGRS